VKAPKFRDRSTKDSDSAEGSASAGNSRLARESAYAGDSAPGMGLGMVAEPVGRNTVA
jgi:hypothetical protein